MSTLERWDILVRFLDGPLAMRSDVEMLGPIIHIGTNPGPTGFKLEGYRGLDGRQAVITVYSGSSVSVAPIGNLQTRVSPDQHVNWADIHPISGPVYLNQGDAIHLGPPGRGATFLFLSARRVGEWRQGRIASSVEGLGEGQPGQPGQGLPDPGQQAALKSKEIRANRGIPVWFIPAIFGMFGFFTLSLGMVVFTYYYTRPDPIGPVEEGVASYDIRVDLDALIAKNAEISLTELDSSSYKGVEGGFEIFIVSPNLKAANRIDLKEDDQRYWDKKLLEWVKRSVKTLASYRAFWRRLDEIKAEYAFVLEELRKGGLPDALAAIPYQESNYRPLGNNFVCAAGYWQFLPEVAKQSGIPIRSCTIAQREGVWEPKDYPPVGILKNAVYINRGGGGYGCLIKKCEVDERADLTASTRGAVVSLGRAWKDEQLRASGSLVQIVIASHNAGYDHSEFAAKEGVKHNSGLRWKFKRWVEQYKKPPFSPDFIGGNLNCESGSGGEGYDPNRTCGGDGPALLGVETQHYVHLIIAQHLLAACYYGQNYSAQFEAFKPYEELSMSNGYCKSFDIPRPETIGGKK